MKEISKDGLAKSTTYLIISKIIFLISGYGVNITAARVLGPNNYGIIGIIISLITITCLFTISGFTSSASKYISENKPWNKSLINKIIKFQIIFFMITLIILILLAPIIANLLGGPSLFPYIILSIFVIPFYSVFSLYSDGFLNGYRLFKNQAISNSIFSILKFLVVLIFLIVGFQVESVIFGYLIATIGSFFVAYYFFRKIVIVKGNNIFPTEKIIAFAFPTILFSISILLVFNVDILILQAILKQNVITGYYTSAAILARIPYFAFSGLSLTLLPSISNSISKNDINNVKNQITKSIRYMLIILLPIMFLISATTKSLLTLIYTKTYENASEPLQYLIFGMGFLSFFNILAYITLGSEKPKIALMTAFFTMIVAVVLNLILIPVYDITGAAIATTIASAIGLIIMSFYIYKSYQVLVKPITFFKISLSSLVIFTIAYYIKLSGIFLITEYIILFLLYILLLWIIKEIDKKDIEMLKNIISFKVRKQEINKKIKN